MFPDRRRAVWSRAVRFVVLLACTVLWLVFPAAAWAQHTAPAPVTLTTAQQIHQLAPDIAAHEIPFRLRGVVTAVSAWQNSFFIQDSTGGVAVDNDVPTGVYDGAEIEMTGVTGPGEFAPIARGLHVKILGPGKMPPAPLFSYNELMQGTHDSNWIALRGVVQSARLQPQWGVPILTLAVETSGGMIVAHIRHYTADDAARLVDAVVHLRGVCLSKFNEKRQLTGIEVDVPATSDIDIEEGPPSDPYSLPITPVQSLLQYKPGRRYNHRVQVTGTVTYQDLGRSLYLQNGNDGILVLTDQNTPAPLGAKISAVGFAGPGAYSPRLTEATFRLIEVGQPVAPASIRADDLLREGSFRTTAPYDGQLVHIEGELVETTARLNDDIWLLRDGQRHVVAYLKHQPDGRSMPKVENGSVVSVTGVLSVQIDENGQPSLFRVLLRSPADYTVVKTASWWSPRHFMPLMVGVLLISLIATLWGATLRRTVRQQTRMLRESEERFRNQAQHDALTGLVSRAFLCEQLQDAIRTARFSGEKLAVLMVDLDFFKQVNDTLGHHAGDELLCLVADRLRAAVRKTDTVARMGGDEFVVLLSAIKDQDEAEEIGAKIVASVSASAKIAGRPMPVSASVGVCLYPDGGNDSDTLLQNVDTAMYKAKASGRNSFSIYAGDQDPRRRKLMPSLVTAR